MSLVDARYVVREIAGGCEIWDSQKQEATFHTREGGALSPENARILAGYYNTGKCPECPPQPMKQRRARCPACRAWISYTPAHPGHKRPRVDERGRLRWSKPVWKPTRTEFLNHLNTAHKETVVQDFYEKPKEDAAPAAP